MGNQHPASSLEKTEIKCQRSPESLPKSTRHPHHHLRIVERGPARLNSPLAILPGYEQAQSYILDTSHLRVIP